MRINRFIAQTGFCSRRKADELIIAGKVIVNGKIVKEPWTDVTGEDAVKVNGKAISVKRHSYICMNKPRGVTTTLSDKYAEVKITDLLPAAFKTVFPVGRLDKDSRGLIILTTDGDLCQRITHPSFQVEKEYIVTVAGTPDRNIIQYLKKGIEDKGEHLKVKAAEIIGEEKRHTIFSVIVCEGKKRHLRRLFAGLGLKVVDLLRIRIGKVRLGRIPEGKIRIMKKEMMYKYFFMDNSGGL